jgi:tetratricopeptide (TPR) repeat protein
MEAAYKVHSIDMPTPLKLKRQDMHNSFASGHSSFAPVTDAETWYRDGEILASNGYYLEALTHFDRAVILQQDYVAAWTLRGVVLIHLGRDREALESCNHALAINPDDQEAWIFRGVALHRLNRYREAYASYNRALRVQYSSPKGKWLAWFRSARNIILGLTQSGSISVR